MASSHMTQVMILVCPTSDGSLYKCTKPERRPTFTGAEFIGDGNSHIPPVLIFIGSLERRPPVPLIASNILKITSTTSETESLYKKPQAFPTAPSGSVPLRECSLESFTLDRLTNVVALNLICVLEGIASNLGCSYQENQNVLICWPHYISQTY